MGGTLTFFFERKRKEERKEKKRVKRREKQVQSDSVKYNVSPTL